MYQNGTPVIYRADYMNAQQAVIMQVAHAYCTEKKHGSKYNGQMHTSTRNIAKQFQLAKARIFSCQNNNHKNGHTNKGHTLIHRNKTKFFNTQGHYMITHAILGCWDVGLNCRIRSLDYLFESWAQVNNQGLPGFYFFLSASSQTDVFPLFL